MNRCKNCYFNEQCSSPNGCEHYAPILEDDDDLSSYIYFDFDEYCRDWNTYVSEYAD